MYIVQLVAYIYIYYSHIDDRYSDQTMHMDMGTADYWVCACTCDGKAATVRYGTVAVQRRRAPVVMACIVTRAFCWRPAQSLEGTGGISTVHSKLLAAASQHLNTQARSYGGFNAPLQKK